MRRTILFTFLLIPSSLIAQNILKTIRIYPNYKIEIVKLKSTGADSVYEANLIDFNTRRKLNKSSFWDLSNEKTIDDLVQIHNINEKKILFLNSSGASELHSELFYLYPENVKNLGVLRGFVQIVKDHILVKPIISGMPYAFEQSKYDDFIIENDELVKIQMPVYILKEIEQTIYQNRPFYYRFCLYYMNAKHQITREWIDKNLPEPCTDFKNRRFKSEVRIGG